MWRAFEVGQARPPWLLLGLLLTGCEFTLPGRPLDYPTTTVSGKITYLGEGVAGGWISFHPIEGAIGNHTIGRIGPDGSYQVTDAPIGRLQVRLDFPSATKSGLLARQTNLALRLKLIQEPASPLTLETELGKPARFDLELSGP